MPHLALLGDSIFDNAAYTGGDPDVITHVRRNLPTGWEASLCAVDGSTTEDIPAQLAALPSNTTHLVLSIGGNNALLRADVLETPVLSSADALRLMADVARQFEVEYKKVVAACLDRKLPLVLCTIYHGNFEQEDYQRRVAVALTVFNDVIIRTAVDNHLTVIDLRLVCCMPRDYANPIEPSSFGGEKIAKTVVRAVTQRESVGWGARLVAGEGTRRPPARGEESLSGSEVPPARGG